MGLAPVEVATGLATAKAQNIQQNVKAGTQGPIVIGADQVAHIQGTLLTKPENEAGAVTQLAHLSGKTHELVTACTVLLGDKTFQILDRTRLSLRRLSTDEIIRYVRWDKPFGCVGAYKFEALGISLVEKVETQDPSAIEGLPLIGLCNVLRQLGVEIP